MSYYKQFTVTVLPRLDKEACALANSQPPEQKKIKIRDLKGDEWYASESTLRAHPEYVVIE